MKEYRTLPGVPRAANAYYSAVSAACSLDLRENKGGRASASWRDAPDLLAVQAAALEESLDSFPDRFRKARAADRANLIRHYRARVRCLRALIRLEAAARGRAGHFVNRRGKGKSTK